MRDGWEGAAGVNDLVPKKGHESGGFQQRQCVKVMNRQVNVFENVERRTFFKAMKYHREFAVFGKLKNMLLRSVSALHSPSTVQVFTTFANISRGVSSSW